MRRRSLAAASPQGLLWTLEAWTGLWPPVRAELSADCPDINLASPQPPDSGRELISLPIEIRCCLALGLLLLLLLPLKGSLGPGQPTCRTLLPNLHCCPALA